MKNLLLLAAILACTLGCTENQRAKSFGGTATEKLPANQKLVNLTWKDASLWILTKPMKKDDVAETYTFQEQSSYGMVQGTVIIVETKQ